MQRPARKGRAQNQRRTSCRDYVVVDRSDLAAVVTRLVEPFPTQRAAAGVAEIDPATLTRLIREQLGVISQDTLDGIYRLLDAEGLDNRTHIDIALRIHNALLSPIARELLDHEHFRRNQEQFGRRDPGLGEKPVQWIVDDDGIKARPWEGKWPSSSARQEWGREFMVLLAFVLTRFPDICTSFHRFVVRRGHYSLRVWIAYERVLGPLLDSRLAGFIERHWIELRGEDGMWSELKAFVDAGLKRERILLDRRADEQRAQQLSENQLEWLAEMPGYEQLARDELGMSAEDAVAIFREFDVIPEQRRMAMGEPQDAEMRTFDPKVWSDRVRAKTKKR